MIIVMKHGSTQENVDKIVEVLKAHGLGANLSTGAQATIIGVLGDKSRLADANLELMDGVEKCVPIMHSYKLASREMCPDGRVAEVGGQRIGGKQLVLMAGPCAVESEEQILEAAQGVKAAGATFLRGGAYKPRTSPYAFQGMEDEGFKLLRKAADATGLKVVSEVISHDQIDTAAKYCDMFQVGARNMQNFELLKELGKLQTPVLLKRGLANTIEEFLMSAEYIMAGGNENVVLCERGIRTFETSMRNTLDISAVPMLKSKTHLPVVIDPSHAAGIAWMVEPLAMAAIAAGADGLMIEVHNDPPHAKSDGAQSLTPAQFDALMGKVKAASAFFGKAIN